MNRDFEKKRFTQALIADRHVPANAWQTSTLNWLILPHCCALVDFYSSSNTSRKKCCGEQILAKCSHIANCAIFQPAYPADALDVCSQPAAVLSSWCQHLIKMITNLPLGSEKLVWYLHEHPQHYPPHLEGSTSTATAAIGNSPDVVLLYPSEKTAPVWFHHLVSQMRSRGLSVTAKFGATEDKFFTMLVTLYPRTIWASFNVNNNNLGNIIRAVFNCC